MKNKLWFVIGILMAIMIFQPFFALSENTGGNKEEIDILNDAIAEKRAKVKEIEKTIEEYKEKINKKRTEAVSLSNQLSIIDNHIIQVELDVEMTEEKIEALKLEIEGLELSIEDKINVVEKQKKILRELIKNLYYESNKKYIEILTAYENFSDFYNRVQYLNKIERDLGKSAKTVRIVKEDLENKKKYADERKSSYEDLQENLVEKKKDLDEQAFLKEDTLSQTQASELTFKTLVNNLKKQYQQIDSEISSIEQEVRKKLESQNKLEQIIDDNTLLSWPTQSRYVTAYFHDPEYPYRHIFEHSGIDIRAAQGTPLKAVASGYVAQTKRCSVASCYSYILIIHSDGIATLYGHTTQILVSNEQFVTRGDVIGYSGGTPGTVGAGPFVTGPHLHFEVRKNGIPVNPLTYLVKDW